MTSNLEQWAFSAFLMFCRIGGCMALAPGFSSTRIPMQVRLLVSMGVVMATGPLVIPSLQDTILRQTEAQTMLMMLHETGVGLGIGLLSRLFFLALQFAASTIAGTIGLAGIPGVPVDEAEAGSPLAAIISSAAAVSAFSLGLHIELLAGVLDSYQVIKADLSLGHSLTPELVGSTLRETTLLALRLGAPFVAYGVVVNVSLGLANRFAPQISLYHATAGLVILGGLFLFHLVIREWLMLFIDSYRSWLIGGQF